MIKNRIKVFMKRLFHIMPEKFHGQDGLPNASKLGDYFIENCGIYIEPGDYEMIYNCAVELLSLIHPCKIIMRDKVMIKIDNIWNALINYHRGNSNHPYNIKINIENKDFLIKEANDLLMFSQLTSSNNEDRIFGLKINWVTDIPIDKIIIY